ncbi:uncharacterized protein [Ptychodera flava]|uniref:uncharacterized protein n=1 Tax=Ptychodera flava TaxID=63121 RepID=UPI003969F68C
MLIFFKTQLLILLLLNSSQVYVASSSGDSYREENVFQDEGHAPDYDVDVVSLDWLDTEFNHREEGSDFDEKITSFSAFGREFNLSLSPSGTPFIRKNLNIELWTPTEKDNFASSRLTPAKTDCFYMGQLMGVPGSKIELSLCDRMFGLIQKDTDAEETYVVEPLNAGHENILPRQRRSSVGERPHVVVRRKPQPKIEDHGYTFMSNQGQEQRRSIKRRNIGENKNGGGSSVDEIGGERNATQVPEITGALHGPYYMETLLVADHELYARFGENTATFMLTNMFLNALKFQESSAADLNFHLYVVRVIVLTAQEPSLNYTDDVSLFRSFNGWQSSINKDDDADPLHHDYAFLYTGAEFPGATGRGICCGNCRQGVGLYSGFCKVGPNKHVDFTCPGHEMGHSLTMNHEDRLPWCRPLENAINPPGGLWGYSWCNLVQLKQFLSDDTKTSCLLDRPDSNNVYHDTFNSIGNRTSVEAGSIYTTDEQCRLFNLQRGTANVMECPWRTLRDMESCHLYCTDGSSGGCQYSGLALQGTPCGDDKWCLPDGTCHCQNGSGCLSDGAATANTATPREIYTPVIQPMTWEAASDFCRAHGGALAEISDGQTLDFITTYLSSLGLRKHFYFDARRVPDGTNAWQNSAGQTLRFFHWNSNKPNDNDGHCVKMMGNAGWKWSDVPCDTKLPSVCQNATNLVPDLGNKSLHINDSSIVLTTKAINENLSDVTVAFWLKTRSQKGAVFSYSTSSKANELSLHEPGQVKLTIKGDVVATSSFVKVDDGGWHLVMLTWSSLGGDWKVYKDGILLMYGSDSAKAKPIESNGLLIIGRGQTKAGDFLASQASMEISSFNIWSEVFTGAEVAAMTSDCTGYSMQGTLLSWKHSDFSVQTVSGAEVVSETGVCDVPSSGLENKKVVFGGRGTLQVIVTRTIPEMQEISACMWLNFSNTAPKGIFSYAVTGSRNEFALQHNWKTGKVRLKVKGRDSSYSGSFNDGRWNHLCVTWTSRGGMWKVYKNGAVVGSGIGLANGMSLTKGGVMVVGHMQYAPAKVWYNYIGEMTLFNVYSTVLTPSEISAMASQCNVDHLAILAAWQRDLSIVDDEVHLEQSNVCTAYTY